MTYILLLTGIGEGCDYTIGCNKQFKVFEAEDNVAAKKASEKFFEYYGGLETIEEMELFCLGKRIKLD